MTTYLLLAAVVMLACVLLNKISGRLGVPTLLAFILLGMVFGSDGIMKIPFDDHEAAEQICSVALIFIMFYGGFGTNWNAAKPVAKQAVLLSSLGVALTAGLVGVFCHFVLGAPILEGLLIGSVICSTDAASVFSILRSRRLNLRYNTASLLELESGSNDPFSYMLTAIVISMMQGSAGVGEALYLIFGQLVYGLAFGGVIAYASQWLLCRVRLAAAGFDAVLVTALAILSYAAPAAVGGNGYLSAYIVGIVLGNSDIRNKKTLIPFFDGLTGMMQMLIFFLLGLLSYPSRLPTVALTALAVALFLTLVARPLAVFAIMKPFGSKAPQLLTVSWAGLRGAASIVFSVMAVRSVELGQDLFHIVFCIVLFSIMLQGSLLPLVARRLGMLDDNEDVLKTFTDYSDEIPVQFIQFTLPEGHPWCGQLVRDIILPPDTLLVMLRRGESHTAPSGSTVLSSGDTLVLSARSPETIQGVHLSEKTIAPNSVYNGKAIWEVSGQKKGLIVLIKRRGAIVIPNGATVLQAGDVLVINHTEPM